MAKEKPQEKPPARGKQESIVSRSSAERFIKEKTDRRVRTDAVDKFVGYIDQLALRLVIAAAAKADQAKRSTLQPEDFEAAFADIAGGTGTTPDSVFSAIDQLSTEQLATLVNTISTWLKDKKPGPRA